MSFPRVNIIKDATQLKISTSFLVEKHELVLDKLKCVGCGQCSIVCPKDAITLHSPEYILENKGDDVQKVVVDEIDPDKCVYCGNCTFFCPFDAIHLFKDGEKVQRNQLTLVKEKALPELKEKPVRCSQLKTDARVYWEGEISINYEKFDSEEKFREYHENTCPNECKNCQDVCPTDAISFRDVSKSLENNQNPIEIDDCLCIKCGACAFACPEDILDVKWKEIFISGAYNKIFWDPIRQKLHNQEAIVSKDQ